MDLNRNEYAPWLLFAGAGMTGFFGILAEIHTSLIGKNGFGWTLNPKVAAGLYLGFMIAALVFCVIPPIVGLKSGVLYAAEFMQLAGGTATFAWFGSLVRESRYQHA